MSQQEKRIQLLMAEDDREDQMLVKRAFEKSRLMNTLDIVENGEDLMDWLRQTGRFKNAPRPDLVLLDLSMPRKDGREVLREMKADPDLHRIPVVVLTSSSADEDILRSYNLGANSYISKPVTFEKLLEVVQALGHYWFEIVKLPPNGQS
jgi:CheY-like chemotaxis protein